MKDKTILKSQRTSHVIEYPGKAEDNFTTIDLATRMQLLLVDPSGMIASNLLGLLQTDNKLEITYCNQLPDELGSFDVALIYLQEAHPEALYLLQSLARHVPHRILVCSKLSSEIAKLAVQFKVDNLLSQEDLSQYLYSALASAANTIYQTRTTAPQTVIINGKAGSGATFVTCCMSEVYNTLCKKHLALVDADFNYGSLAHGLNINSHFSIDQALGELDKLDEAAIRSMMSSEGNFHLLGNTPFARLKHTPSVPAQLDKLNWKIRHSYDEVFVDMSKGLEQQTMPLLNQSETVLVVMQLNVAALRETKAMLKALTDHVETKSRRFAVVINRYVQGKGEIRIKDVREVLGISEIFTISNNFQLARLHTDLGRPLNTLSNHKIITKEITKILNFISATTDDAATQKPGFFARLLRNK